MSETGQSTELPLVLGLAGGVASGKSAVARVLAEEGWLVIDFDAEVQLRLREPEVRNTLVAWWGPGILGPDHLVDRKAVARKVFGNPDERRRLERYLHPLVWRTKGEARAMAAAAGARGVIFDAPLLYEAGLDAECDAVIFVQAPLALRQARAKANRGWEPGELEARESAQLSLEAKAQRSRFLVDNDGTEAHLSEQVRRILATLRSER